MRDKMIKVNITQPSKGDFFQPTKSIRRKYFLGKFEAWFLYEEFLVNSQEYLKEKTKKDLMKLTGLTLRKWDNAIADLCEMGFIKIETSYNKEAFGKIYHFSSIPILSWKYKKEKKKEVNLPVPQETEKIEWNQNAGILNDIK